MISPTTTNRHTDQHGKRTKSVSPDLQAMHDQTNNSYHSSLYRHQAQTSQQNDRSARTPTTFNESASCDSPAPPLKGLFSPMLPPSSVSAPQTQQYAALSTTDKIDYINTLVDYKALDDAMDSSSSTSSIDVTQQCDPRDSLDTMLSNLFKYDELAQDVDMMDQLETISSLRFMCLGTTSSQERRHLLRKLSDGLSETLFHYPPQLSPPATKDNFLTTPPPLPSRYCKFRERKHHLLPLDLLLANNVNQYDETYTAMLENSGISIVEADFTTDNNDTTIDTYTRHQHNHHHDTELIRHYIYSQLQRHRPVSTLQAILHPPSHWDNQPFTGRIYPDVKSNGIDLCVYFYHDAQEIAHIEEDMETLWRISALGIPILPILSMCQQISPSSTSIHPALSSYNTPQPTRTTNLPATPPAHDHGITMNKNDGYLKQRPVDVRRNELANLFSLWRIKMMDISDLDLIGQPSFQFKGKSKWGSTQDSSIENLLGHPWASSSLISPTPYHVLTLHQFMAIDRLAISKLLVAIKRQSKQHHNLDLGNNESTREDPPIKTDTSPAPSATSDPPACRPHKPQILGSSTLYVWLFLLVLLVGGLICVPGRDMLPLVVQKRLFASTTWHGSLIMVSHQCGKSMAFIVNVYHGQEPTWAPEPPLLATNMPLLSSVSSSCKRCCTSTLTYSTISKENNGDSATIVTSLPNNTRQQPLHGQYFYMVPLPPCFTLDQHVDYYVQVKPSSIFSPGTFQGSPASIPKMILCGNPLKNPWLDYAQDNHHSNIMEAWRHFRQHIRFYLLNSIKIIDLMVTEGTDRDLV